MTRAMKAGLKLSLAMAIGLCVLFLNERASITQTKPLVSSADARIGRPLTPMSYAGVARRTTRRAVAVGVAVRTAPVVVAPVPVMPVRPCVQVVDAYGRIYTRC